MFISNNMVAYLIHMIGNFAIQYNFQSLSVAMLILDSTVCTSDDDNCRNGHQALWVAPLVKGIIFLGCMIGQLTMGYAGDVLGISEAMTLTMLISIVGALGSALFSLGEPTELFILLAIFRLILGIGVGTLHCVCVCDCDCDWNIDIYIYFLFIYMHINSMHIYIYKISTTISIYL